MQMPGAVALGMPDPRDYDAQGNFIGQLPPENSDDDLSDNSKEVKAKEKKAAERKAQKRKRAVDRRVDAALPAKETCDAFSPFLKDVMSDRDGDPGSEWLDRTLGVKRRKVEEVVTEMDKRTAAEKHVEQMNSFERQQAGAMLASSCPSAVAPTSLWEKSNQDKQHLKHNKQFRPERKPGKRKAEDMGHFSKQVHYIPKLHNSQKTSAFKVRLRDTS